MLSTGPPVDDECMAFEPVMIRCARCSALVAIQDASRCGAHDTDPMCGFCWRHHTETHDAARKIVTGLPGRCWAEVGTLDWR